MHPRAWSNQSSKDCISCGLSSTLMNNYWALGDRGFAPFQGGTNVFQISDSFDMIRGKHDIKIGGGFRDQQLNVETSAFQDGFFINFGLTGDATVRFVARPVGRRNSRSDLLRRYNRPSLETDPSFRGRHLAGHSRLDR